VTWKTIPTHYVVNKKKLKRNNIFSDRFIWRCKVSTPYFPHQKWALYYLNYIPTILTLENPKPPVINNCKNEKKYLRSLFHK